jgi:plastocyanin domain-containing protein
VKALGGNNFGRYDVNELRVKNNVPVRLHFTAEPGAGCGSVLVIYGMNVRITSRNGQEAIAEFTPQKAGTYTYSCGMMMFGPGKFIVE